MTTDSQQAAGRPSALVTGASSGIGRSFAERLAQDGYRVIFVARRQRLEELARQLRQQTGAEVEVLVADLTQPAQLRTVEQRLASDSALALLVNNAGFAAYMPFLELEPERAEQQIQLHLTAMVRLSRAALSGMVARGRGAVINVSSGLAFTGGLPPQEVVHASLLGLARGEVICLPVLEDASLVVPSPERLGQMLAGMRAGELASRYAAAPGE